MTKVKACNQIDREVIEALVRTGQSCARIGEKGGCARSLRPQRGERRLTEAGVRDDTQIAATMSLCKTCQSLKNLIPADKPFCLSFD